MFELIKTADESVPSAAVGKVVVFIDDTGAMTTKNENGVTAPISNASGGASIPEILTTATLGRALVFADLQNFLPYNSLAAGNFTIPNDATLGITGANLTKNYSIDLGQVNAGKPSFVAGAGVTFVSWTGYPPSDVAVTQTAHRVAPNTWWVK